MTSIDSVKKRLTSPSHQLSGLHLTTKEGYRKLLFLSHEEMLAASDYLIRVGQKFERRADQYEIIG